MKRIIFLMMAYAMFSGIVSAREVVPFDDGWKFSLEMSGDYQEYYSFSNGPVSASYDDKLWKHVVLPHDWAVDLPFSVESLENNGFKQVGWQFPSNSTGWYRKEFSVPADDADKNIVLSFSSVRGRCDVFCNGILAGSSCVQSMPFEIDLTRCIRFGGENVVVVRIDARDVLGAYYQGAGITGGLSLQKTGHLSIDKGRVCLDKISRVGTNSYVLDVHADVSRDYSYLEGVFGISFSMCDNSGRHVSSSEVFLSVVPEQGGSVSVSRQLNISNPSLWSDFRPYLYTVVCELTYNGAVLDRCTMKTGIRDLFVDPDNGVMLNGKKVKINAACAHQDLGAVGAAVPDALWKKRLSGLKALGCNAIRFYGEPVSSAALDACDELGILVMEEVCAADMRSIGRAGELVGRDSHHPSLFMWNVATPQWELEAESLSASICSAVTDVFLSKDVSRHVGTYSGNQKWMSGFFFTEAFDYMGGLNTGGWPNTITGGGLFDYSGTLTPEGDSFRRKATGKKDKAYEKMIKEAKDGGRPFQVKVVPSNRMLRPDGEDIIVLDVSLVDENGRLANSLEHELTVYIDARQLSPFGSSAAMNAKNEFERLYIAGCANGNPSFRDVSRPEKLDAGEFTFKTYKGKAQVILRSVAGSKGKAHVRVGGSRLHGASLNFDYVDGDFEIDEKNSIFNRKFAF